jgi:hypothetical protein
MRYMRYEISDMRYEISDMRYETVVTDRFSIAQQADANTDQMVAGMLQAGR